MAQRAIQTQCHHAGQHLAVRVPRTLPALELQAHVGRLNRLWRALEPSRRHDHYLQTVAHVYCFRGAAAVRPPRQTVGMAVVRAEVAAMYAKVQYMLATSMPPAFSNSCGTPSQQTNTACAHASECAEHGLGPPRLVKR